MKAVAQMNEIYELQVMLRRIAQIDKCIDVVNPSGVYDRETADAVSELQGQNGLPGTGRVDNATWDMITALFTAAVGRITGGGTPLYVFPHSNYAVKAGEISDIVMAVQLMLNALSHVYDDYYEISPSGVYNTETKDAVTHFQGINRLPQTGVVDAKTWDAIANNYNAFVNNPYYE